MSDWTRDDHTARLDAARRWATYALDGTTDPHVALRAIAGLLRPLTTPEDS